MAQNGSKKSIFCLMAAVLVGLCLLSSEQTLALTDGAPFTAENARGTATVQPSDAAELPRDGSITLLDTRTEGEYRRGHIEGFRNIPVDELRRRIGEFEKGKPVYVICQSGLRSYIATRILEGYGFEAYNFAGGFRFYDAVMNDRALVEASLACGMDR